ncbi:polysaccharide deacetylase family protein [Aureimonas mangrovi]|uniref:polysaccharide deacetylase family protein n=1 Tax=Aureimonas mangrovi TaxID=2758041 RepID=UPI00163D581D|nr:polysaccharide deacetylase family protein [Aureimonas mangrovi]
MTAIEDPRDEWAALTFALRQRSEAGHPLRVWWRDDDAVRPTPALAKLLDLSRRHELPIVLAVVPAHLDPDLPSALSAASADVTVAQHGFAHRNEAVPPGRAVECGGRRETSAILNDLDDGRQRLAKAFGERFRPIMVPPWNRIEERITERLPSLGYVGLSVFGEEGERRERGFTVANAHLDVLRWKGGARFAGEAKLLRETLGWLERNPADTAAVFGLLTHHLDHDEATWGFLESFLPLLRHFARPVPAFSAPAGEAPYV